jgi:hypothetical protein
MDKFKNPQLALLLTMSLLIIVLFVLIQSNILERRVFKPSIRSGQFPEPTKVIIIDPASAFGL